MSFNSIEFILARPQLGENIGSCARALKNFNFKKLKIIKPKGQWPNKKAIATSVGAVDVLNSAKIYDNLDKCCENLDLIIATTSRLRNKNKKFINFSQLKEKINKYKNIGFLFGSEASGLTNYEVSKANYLIKIPTNTNFQSLNLSHSVILVCFEIYKILSVKNKKFKSTYNSELANKKLINTFIGRLVKSLDEIGFLQPKAKRDSMIININNIFNRFEISEQELHILQGIFTNLRNRNY